MPRPNRIEFSGAWYHVIHRGTKKPALFLNDSHRQLFLNVLAESISIEGFECHAYCLLNHEVHLLIHTPTGNLSHAMRHLFSVYTQRFNQDTGHTGSLFKDRFKAVLLDPDDYLQADSRFIHQLPSLQRIPESPLNYPWSSFPAYVGKAPRPRWLQISTILPQYPRPFEKYYGEYVLHEKDDRLIRFFKRKKLSPFLGSTGFVMAAKNSAAAHKDTGSTTTLPSMDVLIQSTAMVMKETVDDILISKRGRGNQQLGRTVAMYLCRHIGQHSIKDIAEHFGVGHESAVSVRLARFKTFLEHHPDVQSKLNLLVKTAGRFSL